MFFLGHGVEWEKELDRDSRHTWWSVRQMVQSQQPSQHQTVHKHVLQASQTVNHVSLIWRKWKQSLNTWQVSPFVSLSGRFHIDTSPSTGFSARVSKVALYCQQCYVMWTLRYVRNNDYVIIDVKTFWRPFLLFSWQKKKNLHKNCSYFKVTRTCTEPVLLLTAAIGIHANSCLVWRSQTRTSINANVDSHICSTNLFFHRVLAPSGLPFVPLDIGQTHSSAFMSSFC